MSFTVDDFWDRLSGERVVMLTDGFGGGLRARPMAPIVRQDEHAVWFMTDRNSSKVEEILAHPSVCLSVAHAVSNDYMSVTGTAMLVDDPARIRDFWSQAAGAFFSGPDDPRIVLLRVEPEAAEIWSGPSVPVAAVKMAIANLTGSRPDLGETGHVDLQR